MQLLVLMYLKSKQNHTVKYPTATYMYIHIKLKPHANILNDKATFHAFTAGIQSRLILYIHDKKFTGMQCQKENCPHQSILGDIYC